MAKLSKDAKQRIIISLTSQPVGQEVIDAIEGGKVLSGNGIPANTLGSNGDLYVNLLTGDLYDKANNAWSFVSGGGGGPVSWGGIGGTLSNQSDLQSALDSKYDASNPDGFVDAVGAAAAAPVQSVNTKTGHVVLDKTDIGLGNVDNTSDLDKPISNDTQDALDLKVDKAGDTMTGPLNMSALSENIQFSVYGMNSTSDIEIKSDDQTIKPSGNVKLTSGNAEGADSAGSIYLTGGSNVDGNPANIILQAGISSGTGVNGSITLDSKQVVYLNQNPSGYVDAVNHNIQNVLDPISPQDAATKKWVEDISAITNTLVVDASASIFGADGSLFRPYNTVADALAVAVDGTVIIILPGIYSESTITIPNTLKSLVFLGTSQSATTISNGFSYTAPADSIDILFEKINIGQFTFDASSALNGLVNIKQSVVSYNRIDNNMNVFMITTESNILGGAIAGGGNNFSEVLIVVSPEISNGLLIIENSKFVQRIEVTGVDPVTVRTLDCELFGSSVFVHGNGSNTTWETDLSTDALGSSVGVNKVLLANVPLSNITQSGAAIQEVPAWDGSNWVPTDIIGATLESTGTLVGIKDASQVSIAVNDGTRTFTVAPVSGSYECYAKGKKLVISSSKQIVWSNTPGVHFFYLDENENLATTTTFIQSLITEYVFLSMVYWDDVAGKHIIFANERHGINMGTFTHLYLHNTRGAQFGNGLKLVNFVVDGGGGSNTHAQFTANSGSIWDEDIKTVISAQTQFPVFYRNGSGNWKRKEANSFPVIMSGEEGYTGPGGRLPYNRFDGTNWSLTEVDNNKFVLVHVFGTNDMEFPIICIQGQNQYSDKTSARAGALIEIKELSGLPVLEFCPLGSVIFQTSNSYTNTPKAQIVSTADGDNYEDHRSESIRPGSLA